MCQVYSVHPLLASLVQFDPKPHTLLQMRTQPGKNEMVSSESGQIQRNMLIGFTSRNTRLTRC